VAIWNLQRSGTIKLATSRLPRIQVKGGMDKLATWLLLERNDHQSFARGMNHPYSPADSFFE
jgi:hypothetical protein